MGNTHSEEHAAGEVEDPDEGTFFDASHGGLVSIPSEAFAVPKLEKAMLQSNQLHAVPERVFSISTLRSLNISDNEVAELPDEIGDLLALEELLICKNAIETIPDTIGQLKNLKLLDANSCPLDALPDAICECESLMQLTLSDIYLDGLPQNLGKLSRLEVLELRENQLNCVPSSFFSLARLRRLDLGSNRFEVVPYGFSRLFSLQELYIDQNKLTEFPEGICQLDSLKTLDLSNNAIEYIPNEFNQLRNLTDLELSNNTIQELPEISSLTRLVSIRVNRNQLTFLPESLGSCTAIQELSASSNNIAALPKSVGELQQLSSLCLDDNDLQELPEEIGECWRLSLLSVRGNSLRLLPWSIENLDQLRVLNIVDNRIQYLPQGLAGLDSLTALWMSDNQARPLIPLQTDYALDGITVLTCYMLPQNPKKKPDLIEPNNNDSDSEIEEPENGDTLGAMMGGGLGSFAKEPGGAAAHNLRRSMISFGQDVSTNESKPPSVMPREARTRGGRQEAESLKRTSVYGNPAQNKGEVDPIYDNLPNLPKKTRVRRSFVDELDEAEEDLLRDMIAQHSKKGKKEKKSKKSKDKDKDKGSKGGSAQEHGASCTPVPASGSSTPTQNRHATPSATSNGRMSVSSDPTSPQMSPSFIRRSRPSSSADDAFTTQLDGEMTRRTPTPLDRPASRPTPPTPEPLPQKPPKPPLGAAPPLPPKAPRTTAAGALPAVTPTTSFSSSSSSPAAQSSLDWRLNTSSSALPCLTDNVSGQSTNSENSVSPEPAPPPRSSSYNRMQKLQSPDPNMSVSSEASHGAARKSSAPSVFSKPSASSVSSRPSTSSSVFVSQNTRTGSSAEHHTPDGDGHVMRRAENFDDARARLANMMVSAPANPKPKAKLTASLSAGPYSVSSVGVATSQSSIDTSLSRSSSNQNFSPVVQNGSASGVAKPSPPVAKKPPIAPKPGRSPQKSSSSSSSSSSTAATRPAVTTAPAGGVKMPGTVNSQQRQMSLPQSYEPDAEVVRPMRQMTSPQSYEPEAQVPRPMSAEPSSRVNYSSSGGGPSGRQFLHYPQASAPVVVPPERLTEPGQRHSISTMHSESNRLLSQPSNAPTITPAAPMFLAKGGRTNHFKSPPPPVESSYDGGQSHPDSRSGSAMANGYVPSSLRPSSRNTTSSGVTSGSMSSMSMRNYSSDAHGAAAAEGDNIDTAQLTPTVMYVVLRKRTTLGFKVTGGMGSGGNPYLPQDAGVFVSEVLDRSTCVSGEVKQGDKLLALDNVPLDNLSHRDAVNVLRQAAGLIRLKILRFVPSDAAGTLF